MSTPVSTDLILVNRGGVDYYCSAADWATAFSGSGGSTTIGPNQIPVELLVVGGGGAGATRNSGNNIINGAGGGGGRVVWFKEYVITKGNNYAITVGAGGDPGINTPDGQLSWAAAGGNSSFGSIIAGGGGFNTRFPSQYSCSRGGSGGGGYSGTASETGPAQGTKPAIITPTFMDLGHPGGDIAPNVTSGGSPASGGGGGAGGRGVTVSSPLSVWAHGGPAAMFDITGTPQGYGGGGGGGGGGGQSGGGYGGGAARASTSAASAGVVILAYPDTYTAPTTVTGTHTQPVRSGYRVYQWTGSGSITF